MTKSKNLPTTLPPKEITFSLSVKGSVTKQEFSGDFMVKIPTVRDMSRIGIELAKLNGGVKFEHLDPDTAILNNGVAYLRVLLVEAPKWFIEPEQLDYGMNTVDSNIVMEVFNAAQEKVNNWYKALKGDESNG